MLLYTPQVQLFYEVNTDSGLNEYSLHVVTFCDLTNLRESGYLIHSKDPDQNQTIIIDLFIQEDSEKPQITSLNPIVHTISIGPVAFTADGFFETRVILQPTVMTRGSNDENQTKGSTTTSTTSANEIDRPIREDLQVPVLF